MESIYKKTLGPKGKKRRKKEAKATREEKKIGKKRNPIKDRAKPSANHCGGKEFREVIGQGDNRFYGRKEGGKAVRC